MRTPRPLTCGDTHHPPTHPPPPLPPQLELEETARGLQSRIDRARSLVMKEQLRHMKRVLRRLGLVDAEGVVTLKGRVACEVNTADELLVTELIFNGVFNDLDARQAAALLSCLIYEEKGSDEDAKPLREELAAPLRALQAAARRIASVSVECKIEVSLPAPRGLRGAYPTALSQGLSRSRASYTHSPPFPPPPPLPQIDAEEYVQRFRPEMMELVYAWVGGAKFVDIASMTKQFEGSIIRVIRRLEGLCRQLGDAARGIGEERLSALFLEARARSRRDIVFAASLYL